MESMWTAEIRKQRSETRDQGRRSEAGGQRQKIRDRRKAGAIRTHTGDQGSEPSHTSGLIPDLCLLLISDL
jgi:hypothetical protein